MEDYAAAIAAIPEGHRSHRTLTLPERVLGRDLTFLVRHPTCLFQQMWNYGWWYDCDEAKEHHVEPEGGWPASGLPWQYARESRLSRWVERWRSAKEKASLALVWIRSMRPPQSQLDSGLRSVFGSSDFVSSVAYSSDGIRIASGSRDDMVRVWDAATGLQR